MSSLHCIIKTRQQTLYEGDIVALTSRNKRGVFDILPQHSNFITLLDSVIVVHEPSGRQQQFPVPNGVLQVSENSMQVFLGFRRQ